MLEIAFSSMTPASLTRVSVSSATRHEISTTETCPEEGPIRHLRPHVIYALTPRSGGNDKRLRPPARQYFHCRICHRQMGWRGEACAAASHAGSPLLLGPHLPRAHRLPEAALARISLKARFVISPFHNTFLAAATLVWPVPTKPEIYHLLASGRRAAHAECGEVGSDHMIPSTELCRFYCLVGTGSYTAISSTLRTRPHRLRHGSHRHTTTVAGLVNGGSQALPPLCHALITTASANVSRPGVARPSAG